MSWKNAGFMLSKSCPNHQPIASCRALWRWAGNATYSGAMEKSCSGINATTSVSNKEHKISVCQTKLKWSHCDHLMFFQVVLLMLLNIETSTGYTPGGLVTPASQVIRTSKTTKTSKAAKTTKAATSTWNSHSNSLQPLALLQADSPPERMLAKLPPRPPRPSSASFGVYNRSHLQEINVSVFMTGWCLRTSNSSSCFPRLEEIVEC